MKTIYLTQSQHIYIETGYDSNTKTYYNLNSPSIPDNTSTQYDDSIYINTNTLLRAINYNTITEQYSSLVQLQFVRILSDPELIYLYPNYYINSHEDSDVLTIYTLDESIPSTNNGTIYTSGSIIPDTTNIKMINVKQNCIDSNVVYGQAQVPDVYFNYDSGTYLTNISLQLNCSLDDSDIYYTLNGSTPTTQSILYSTSILLSQHQHYTVKAFAVYPG